MSQQINLFNPIFKQQKKYLSAVTMAQAIGLILTGSLLLAGYVNYRSVRLKSEANSMTNKLTATQEQLARVTIEYAPRQKNQALETEILKLEAELDGLKKVEHILQKGELGNTKGYAEYMRAFARQIGEGIWLTGFSIQGAGSEIALQGKALSPDLVPAYIGRLKSEAILQGKSFSSLEIRVPRPASANATAAASKPTANMNYLEFALQSSGAEKTAESAKGAQGK